MDVGETAYVQFSAWDSKTWGLSYSGVPLGGSVASGILTTQIRVQNSDSFLQIAFPEKIVVPTSVPEPHEWVLFLVGAWMVVGWRGGRRR